MLLIVGWDGASPELLERFRAAGSMPVLDRLAKSGHVLPVASTIPAVTFPAWTTFLTGAFPDRHGLTDFTIPRPGSYAVRFANASDRRLPTILARLTSAGRRVGMYGVPATFPPEARAVFEICGFDTPLGAGAADRATHPRELGEKIRRRHGRLGIEGISQSRIADGWHENTQRRLVEDIELRTTIAVELAREHALDVFVVHFMEPDTAAHHFWQFDDPRSPRHRAGPRGVLQAVYEALDASLGRLVEAAGADSDVVVLSDHGSAGASDRVIFWNRWLQTRGLLRFRGGGAGGVAARAKRAAMARIPERWQARLFAAAGGLAGSLESRARFGNIDWSATAVYSDEVPYLPSLRLNLAGREPGGIVRVSEREHMIERVTGELLAMRDPVDGGCVVERVRRRDELFDGPFADRYPDLVLELRRPDGYAYAAGSSRGGLEREWLRRLRDEEASGARGSSTSGVHSPTGVAVLAGPSIRELDDRVAASCTLADLGATALALARVAPSTVMQGRSLVGRALAPVPDVAEPAAAFEYDEDEEREVRERLRALGYLA